MRIIYVARHGNGGNQDEDAITASLVSLGHDVERVQEHKGRLVTRKNSGIVLFHKWEDLDSMRSVKVPKVFWYFDLISYPDPALLKRNNNRITWMNEITPMIDLGFCTDGDWVNKDQSGKLIRLTQGADLQSEEQYLRYRQPKEKTQDLLFAGIDKGGGTKRVSHVRELKSTYGSRFLHIERTYKEELFELISKTKIIIAPDNPATNHYWSNRVYNTLGFGGFMLHPYCSTLQAQYRDGREIVFYHSRKDLHEKIEYYLEHDKEREKIALAGLDRTWQYHTYQHRCETLMNVVKERLM